MSRRNTAEKYPDVDRLVSPAEARYLLSIGRTSEAGLRRSDPTFPRRVAVGPGAFAYRLSELSAWIASRPVAPTVPPPERAIAARKAQVRERRAKAAHG